MIFKVLYQEDKLHAPRRESTKTLYLKANNITEARQLLEKNTNYNIELIQELTGNFLEYEKNSPNYKLTEF